MDEPADKAKASLKVAGARLKKEIDNSGQKKKPDTTYFYHNLVLLLKKYIKSMTILKIFKKSSI